MRGASAASALPSRRNTKFPYSDAPRQKLTLLRFIDPQYCVPPRGAVLRARSNVHEFAPSLVRARRTHPRPWDARGVVSPPLSCPRVPGGAGIRFNGVSILLLSQCRDEKLRILVNIGSASTSLRVSARGMKMTYENGLINL